MIAEPDTWGSYLEAQWSAMRRVFVRVERQANVFPIIKRLGVNTFVAWVLRDEARRSGFRGRRQNLRSKADTSAYRVG